MTKRCNAQLLLRVDKEGCHTELGLSRMIRLSVLKYQLQGGVFDDVVDFELF